MDWTCVQGWDIVEALEKERGEEWRNVAKYEKEHKKGIRRQYFSDQLA